MTGLAFDISSTIFADRGTASMALDLVHGGRVETRIGYERCGPRDAPVVIVMGGISAGRHVIANPVDRTPGWWDAQRATFADHDLVAIDSLGSDGGIDRPIDPADQARALLAVLDHLGIGRADAFVGASYGAMVGMHVAALAPERLGALLSFGAAHRAHPFASAQRAIQRQLIEWGEASGEGPRGLSLARQVAMLSYRCPDEFGTRFDTPASAGDARVMVAAEPWLAHHGALYARRSPVACRRLSESIDLHRIDPARIGVPATFVAFDSDRIVPVADVETLAAAAPHGRFHLVRSAFGHDAFLKERVAVGALIDRFLAQEICS